MGFKVIQWTTGHVGRETAKAILAHPELELVGCYAWSESKVGKDVGELCGIDAVGVTATNDVEALLGLGADCVCYVPTFPNMDELVRLLEAGLNVACSYFVNARSWGEEVRTRLQQAAERGGVSLFGSGIFPGFANYICAQMATVSSGFRCIRFLESVDVSTYQAIHNYANLGWGQPPEDKWLEVSRAILGTYDECLDVMADMLGVPVTERRFACEFATTPNDREYFGFPLPAGSIAGQKSIWTAMVGDEPVIEIQVVWNAGEGLEPSWPVQHGYLMEVEGNPNIRTKVGFSPSKSGFNEKAYVDMANTVTAMPVISAIPAVCGAEPGIRTYADLPLITGRYVP